MKNKIKYLLKLNNADVLINNTSLAKNIIIGPKFYYVKFGEKNKDKTFYVIQRSPGAGFFSNLLFVLYHLINCDRLGAFPVIDNQNFPNLYNVNANNSWNYFFEDLNLYSLNEVYESERVIITESLWPTCFPKSIEEPHLILDVYRKYIKIQPEVLVKIQSYLNQNFKNKKILGVHFRGREQRVAASHPFPPTFKQLEKTIVHLSNVESFDYVFVVTENTNNLNQFKNRFKNKVIYFESARSNSNVYNDTNRDNHRLLLGQEILIEALLLAKCDYFVCGDSNVSEFSKLLFEKDKSRIFQIDNGINSDSRFLSKILWYLKANLPRILGGFNNNYFLKFNIK